MGRTALWVALLVSGVVGSASGQQGELTPKIAWFGTWKTAKAEAKRTGKPILLVAAAPHCRNISGVW